MTDPSTKKRQLPLLPHADHLRKQAKARLAILKVTSPNCRLADAQRTLAQDYGFDSWKALQAETCRRATTTAARQIRTRRRFATLHLRKTRWAEANLSGAFLPSGQPPAFLTHLDEEPFPPIAFLRAGALVPVCFAVAALIGVGILCFVMSRAGIPFHLGQGPVLTPSELLHQVF